MNAPIDAVTSRAAGASRQTGGAIGASLVGGDGVDHAADPLPAAVVAAAARASREQIGIARAAADIERWLRREGRDAIDVERLLAFVAQVRLSSALTGGDLSEILLFEAGGCQTDGAWRPTSAGAAGGID